MQDIPGRGINRRTLMTGTIGAAVAVPFVGAAQVAEQKDAVSSVKEDVGVTLRINDQRYKLTLDVRTTLLDALRDHAGLTGTKKGCDHGQCGACTVLVDGERQLSCLSLAVMNDGKAVTTIEGLSGEDGGLHPMQQAFVDHDAFQCGYCTPGQILAGIGCVNEGHADTPDDIREYMSGNLCRCAAYPNIVAAVEQARDRMGRG